MTDQTNPRWYAVMTEPQREAVADRRLRRQGFKTFYPVIRVRRRKRRPGTTIRQGLVDPKWEDVSRFMNYTFVLARDGELSLVSRTPAVVALVGPPGQEPMPIPDQIMTALMQLCDDEAPVDEVARELLPAGTEIIVSDRSPFAGFIAQISLDLGNKIVAECFGRRVVFPPEAIGEIVS